MSSARSVVTVSVVIPCFNGEHFLAEAIESVLQQTHPATEIILVDDGSTDKTAEIAARYADVKYIYQKNQGVSAARNTGLNASRGDYIVFLDHDDRLLPQALERGVCCSNSYPECGFILGLSETIQADGSSTASQHTEIGQPLYVPLYSMLLCGSCLTPIARFMFRRSILENIGGFDTTLQIAEDYDLYLRAAAIASGHCHHHVVVEYREHCHSLTQTIGVSSRLLASLKALDKQQSHASQNVTYNSLLSVGKQHWHYIYHPHLVHEVVTCFVKRQFISTARALYLLLRYYPQGLVNYSEELISKVSQRFNVLST